MNAFVAKPLEANALYKALMQSLGDPSRFRLGARQLTRMDPRTLSLLASPGM